MSRTINIETFLDEQPVSRTHILVIVLLGLAMFADGFDIQVMGYVAPAVVADLGLSREMLGPVFGAGLAGMMVGSFTWSLMSDKIGRKAVILAGLAVFGIFSLLTVFAQDVTTLLILRFLTGIGMGGVMPNCIALTSEYAPKRHKKTFVMLMWFGYTAGSGLGGVISAMLIGAYGWHSAFVFGGVLPLALIPLLWWALPESARLIQNQAHLPDRQQRIARILSRFDRTIGPDTTFVTTEEPVVKKDDSFSALRGLFDAGRMPVTLIIWLLFFFNLMQLKFLTNWMPTLMSDSGLSADQAIYVTSTIYIGSLIGTVVITLASDRINPFVVLAVCYALGGLATGMVGQVGANMTLALALAMAIGIFVSGSQVCANALVAQLYPTSCRASGVGWALGVGRIGSIVGPTAVSALFVLGWSIETVFIAAALPATISVIAVLVLGSLTSRRERAVASSAA